MNFNSVMTNTSCVLVHRPTGRQFFYVPAHNAEIAVDGLTAVVYVTETFAEIINGVLCPMSLPTTFFYDEWDAGTLESVLPGAFCDEGRMREADAENRVGFVNISADLYREYGAALRSVRNIRIKNESVADDNVILMFSSPDIAPVFDGQSTPEYLVSFFEGENRLSFELVKQPKL